MNQDQGNFWNCPFYIRDVVNTAVAIEEMRSADVGFTALQGQQGAQAADIGGGDLELRIAELQLVFEHAYGEIVTTCAKNRIFDILDGSKQFNVGLLTSVEPFNETWNAQQTVGVHHRGDHARAARKRHRDQFFTYPSQRHAEKFFQAQMRGDFLRHNGAHVCTNGRGTPKKFFQRRA